jgi:hypothetical protein
MVNSPVKKNNNINFFLNDYFNIILALVLVLFLLIAYLVFLNPKFQATKAAIQANTEEKRVLYETTQKRLVSLKAIYDVYQKISPADLQKFNSVLPDNYVRERLFGELEEIIGRGGWLVSDINISPLSDTPKEIVVIPAGKGGVGPNSASVLGNKKIGTINIQLSISAIDYSGLKNLLNILENNLRLFDITSIEFSSSGNSVTVMITTYYYEAL